MDDFEDIFEDEFLIDTDESDDTFTLNDDWDDDTEDMPLEPYLEEELFPDDWDDDDIFDDELVYGIEDS
jgi:hypothetical protein